MGLAPPLRAPGLALPFLVVLNRAHKGYNIQLFVGVSRSVDLYTHATSDGVIPTDFGLANPGAYRV